MIAEWIIAGLYLVSFSGLAYGMFSALRSGAAAYAGEYSQDTARQFEDIFLFIPPAQIRRIGWTAAATFFMALFLAAGDLDSLWGFVRGALAGSLAGGLGLYLPSLAVRILRVQRLRRFELQLEDSLGMMSNSLKAGFSIAQAFEAVVRENRNPISQEFAVMLHQTRVGVRFEDALVNLERRVNSEDLTLMVRAIEIARSTGGNLTEVFDKIAETIRERLRIQGRIRTLTAQGKLQGIVVGIMPLLLGLALFTIDPRMMRSFVSSPTGMVIMVVVAILELAGGLLIRKIVRIDV